MKRVLIITTGGTIAMGRDSSGAVRVLDENVLIRQQSALASVAHVDFFTFSNLPSVHLTLDHVIRLRRLILDKAKDYDGIVVTHGTDTLEETAFFLDLTLPLARPVILTGAMRSSNEPGSDGFLNLLHSVQVAAIRNRRNKGVLVVMNGEIHGARFVREDAHQPRGGVCFSPIRALRMGGTDRNPLSGGGGEEKSTFPSVPKP